MPGYDLKVDGDYARLDSLQCTYCKLILRDAIQTSEGQRFCKTCWEQIEKFVLRVTYLLLYIAHADRLT